MGGKGSRFIDSFKQVAPPPVLSALLRVRKRLLDVGMGDRFVNRLRAKVYQRFREPGRHLLLPHSGRGEISASMDVTNNMTATSVIVCVSAA